MTTDPKKAADACKAVARDMDTLVDPALVVAARETGGGQEAMERIFVNPPPDVDPGPPEPPPPPVDRHVIRVHVDGIPEVRRALQALVAIRDQTILPTERGPTDHTDLECDLLAYVGRVVTLAEEGLGERQPTAPETLTTCRRADVAWMQEVFTAARDVTRKVRDMGSCPGELTLLVDALSRALRDGPLWVTGRAPKGGT